MKTQKVRRAFTLVELLVVIAIIGILVALLLPAVQAAREAARRMQCGNNLKQIALGLHNYHDTYKSFPSAYIHAGAASNESWAWGALTLPFIEQSPLHDKLGVTRASLYQWFIMAGPATKASIQTSLPTFICPSDTLFNKPGLVHANRNFNDGNGVTSAGVPTPVWPGVSNYLGAAGHRDVANRAVNTGVFFGDSNINLRDVIDGTSNTIIVGERDTFNCRSGSWVAVRNPNGGGTRGIHVVTGHSHPKINQDTAAIAWNIANIGCGEGFSSLHPGGAQFALCDGSVRFLAETINHNWYGTTLQGTISDHIHPTNGTFQRLMSRNDQMPVGEF